MDDLDTDEKSARRRQRAEQVDGWFERRWPNRYERFVARFVIYVGSGSAVGFACGQLIDVLLDRWY